MSNQKKFREYQVGDRVKIRQWDDMAKEFGINWFGNIQSPCEFGQYMKYQCGKTGTITTVRSHDKILYYYVDFDIGNDDIQRAFTSYMLEPVSPLAKRSITVTYDGTLTEAVERDGDRIVRTAGARRNPADEEDFMKGATLALERLEEQRKAEELGEAVKNIEVGDLVHVREDAALDQKSRVNCGCWYQVAAKDEAEMLALRVYHGTSVIPGDRIDEVVKRGKR